MNAIANFLSTRRGVTIAGWLLLFISFEIPSGWWGGKFEGSAGYYAFANLIRPEMFPDSPFAALPRALLVGLAFCTNVVFLFGIWFRDQTAPSRAFRAVLVAAIAVDLAVALVLRDFARMAGYWVWLAGIVAVAWGFIGCPAKGRGGLNYAKAQMKMQSSDDGKGGLPEIVWAWIGWLAFWMAITFLTPWIKPAVEEDKVAKAARLTGYVNDFAGALKPATVERVSAALAQFEKETSNQVAVALYAQLPDIPVEEFTIAVAEKSRLGRKGLDNGAILSIFVKDKVARVEVGYGLEGALTDAQTHRILESILAPAWRGADPDKAVEDSLVAITGAVREEYRGGRMPGRAAIFWRQLTVEVPKLVKGFLPTLAAMPADARFGISFFGSFFLLGFIDGFVQTRVVVRNAATTVRNLRAGRAMFAGTTAVRESSIFDTMKILIFLGAIAYAVVGIVVVAGGGAFGSGGATLHW